jgi:hypothetical protein
MNFVGLAVVPPGLRSRSPGLLPRLPLAHWRASMDPGSDCGSDCGGDCVSWQSSPTGKNEVLQRARRGTGPTLARGLGSNALGNFKQRCQSGRRNSPSQASSSHASANSRSRDKLLVFMALERTVTRHERASPALTDPVLVWSFSPGLSAPPYVYVCLSPCPGPFWSV